MVNYKILKEKCTQNSDMFSYVVEEFLFRNVVNHKKFAGDTNIRFAPFRHVIQEFQDGWFNMFMMQYIVHAILKKGGLIKSYLKHSAMERLKQNERNYLEHMAAHPWRFSFSIITRQPHDHFFEMEDVFTGESFLLYSPGVADILKERPISLWFNLIGFNGECWQSFGPIGAYQAFTPDDIFFFGAEVNPRKLIESDLELVADVEDNPVPYMMLISGSTYPLTVHKNDLLIQAFAEYDLDALNTKGLDKYFTIEYVTGIYRLSLKRWSGHPHFAAAYYDETGKRLILYAMTDRGFRMLADRLKSLGYNLHPDPDIRVTIAMVITINKILKTEIQLNEYDSLFKKEESPADKETIGRLNSFLAMAMPEINAGRKPDVKSMARKAGIDEETASSILKHFTDKLDNMK